MDEREKRLAEKLHAAFDEWYSATDTTGMTVQAAFLEFTTRECLRLMAQQEWVKVADLPDELEDTRIEIAVRHRWSGACCDCEPGEACTEHVEAKVGYGTIYRTQLQTIATLDDGDEYEVEDILGWREISVLPTEGGKE